MEEDNFNRRDNLRGILWMLTRNEPTEQGVDDFLFHYNTNPYVHNLVNLVEVMYKQLKEKK